MIQVTHYIILSSIIFCIGFLGVLMHRKNTLIVLMAIELLLLAVNINFVAFSYYLQSLHGQIFVFFVLTVAASEAAIALAILVLIFRAKKNIDLQTIHHLNG